MEYIAHEAAKILGITVPALRYYEKAGLLPPIIRNKAGNRIYTETEMEWLYMIVLMRNTGISIQEIRQYTSLLLEGPETMGKRYEFVKQYKEKIEEKIHDMQKSLEWLTVKADFYEEMLHSDQPCQTFEEESSIVRKRLKIKEHIVEPGGGKHE